MYRVCSCVVQFSRDPAEARAEMDEDVFPPSLYREILDDKKRHPRRLSSKNPRVWLNKVPSPTRSSPLASAGHAVCHLAGDPRGSGLRAGIVRRLGVQHILAERRADFCRRDRRNGCLTQQEPRIQQQTTSPNPGAGLSLPRSRRHRAALSPRVVSPPGRRSGRFCGRGPLRPLTFPRNVLPHSHGLQRRRSQNP